MTISNELNTLQNNLNSIKTSIRNQGQSVSPTDTLSNLDNKIVDIPNVIEHTQYILKDILHNELKELQDTQSTIIRTHGFHNLTRLEKITFTNIIKICPFAFQNCYRLKTLYLNVDRVVELPSLCAFRYTPLEKLKGEIYVPSTLWDTYKNHPKWGYFKTILKPIGSEIITTGVSIIIPNTLPQTDTYQFI